MKDLRMFEINSSQNLGAMTENSLSPVREEKEQENEKRRISKGGVLVTGRWRGEVRKRKEMRNSICNKEKFENGAEFIGSQRRSRNLANLLRRYRRRAA